MGDSAAGEGMPLLLTPCQRVVPFGSVNNQGGDMLYVLGTFDWTMGHTLLLCLAFFVFIRLMDGGWNH